MEKIIKLPFKECLEAVFGDNSEGEIEAVVHCKTKEIFDEILDLLPEYGLNKIYKGSWGTYKESTVLTVYYNRVYFGSVEFHKDRGDDIYIPIIKEKNW